MEINYIILLDCSSGVIIKIKLSEEEKEQAQNYKDTEEFLRTLEDTYNFRMKSCSWMATDTLLEKEFNI